MPLATILPTCGFSQQPAEDGTDIIERAGNRIGNAELPTSIFNDKIRRFKFRLEHLPVTRETAEAFSLRFSRPNNPRIIGAYADAETNSLVVVGPPEAEQAIRENLAEWIVETHVSGTPPLEIQKRVLEYRRKELLAELASIEVYQLKAGNGGNNQAKGKKEIDSRLQSFEDELRLVERQIVVVNKYLDRLHNDGPGAAKNAGLVTD
jgi:hypothetical protein